MPFNPVRHPDVKHDHSTELPSLVIIGDITGSSLAAETIGRLLDLLNEGWRSIFAYEDPRLKDPDISYNTLDDHIDDIYENLPGFPFKPYDFGVVGISAGCVYAVKVALRALKDGHNPHVFLIDGPSAYAEQNYFNTKKIAATEDLMLMFNYACSLSELDEIHLDEDTIVDIASRSLGERLDFMKEALLKKTDTPADKKATPQKIATLTRYLEVIQQNLKNICESNEDENNLKLDKINLLLTARTAEKYSRQDGGWVNYANEVELVLEQNLARQSHRNLALQSHIKLLKEPSNCERIADLIYQTFNGEVPEEKPLKNEVIYMIDQYSQEHPNVDVVGVLDEIKRNLEEKRKSREKPSNDGTISLKPLSTTSATEQTGAGMVGTKAKQTHGFFGSPESNRKTDTRRDNPTSQPPTIRFGSATPSATSS